MLIFRQTDLHDSVRTSAIAVTFVLLVGLSGCATHAHQLEGIRDDYYSGHLEKSAKTIDQLLAKETKESDALKLDRAIVELTSGQPDRAEQTLRQVRDRLDHLEQKDAGEQALSMIRDDQSVSWSGEDYEKVLVRTFLAISNLMNGGDDAGAYALQVDEKQNQIIAKMEQKRRPDEAELDFKRIALGPYIHAAMTEERHSNYDDIERSRLKVVSWEEGFRDGKDDLQRARHGRHSEPGNGVVYLFCLVGRGPYKVEANEIPTQVSMLIVDQILSNVLDQTLTPTIAPVKIPVVKPGRSVISNVGVIVDGDDIGTTATITNVSEFAVQQSEANRSEVLARAVVRRTLKKAAAYAVKSKVNAQSSPVADIALTVAGIAWEAAENADTRCWGLLPDQIQVLRVELPAGEHQFELKPLQGGKRVGRSEGLTVQVEDGRNTYLLATIPDTEFVGEVVTNFADRKTNVE